MSELLIVVTWLGWGAIVAGMFFCCAGTVGLLRFPDPLSRLHAITKADNLGIGLVVLGLVLHAPGIEISVKLVLLWLLTLLASATAGHLVARVARPSAGEQGEV